MSHYNESGIITRRATIAAAAYLRVKHDATDDPLGIALSDAADVAIDLGTLCQPALNDDAPIAVVANGHGSQKQYVASGAITLGAQIGPDDGGKVTTGTGLGTAATAAAADGDVITVNSPL